MSNESLIEAAQAAAGPGTARAAAPADAIDGVQPRVVVEPPNGEAVAAALAWASREKLCVVTRGGGTKLEWGPPPSAVDFVLSTARMDALVAHRHGDLTATVEAGAPLARVNRELARHGQWIPLDPPWADRATIGGIVATNDSGPRRQRYGAPRDLIIGVGLARADGHLAKGGGIVVKNVAGYDLPRLLTGSFGSLAVIVSATFKLFPMAQASRTVMVELAAPGVVGPLIADLLASQLAPTAIELEIPAERVLIRFESVEAAVERQASEAARLAEARRGAVRILQGDEEAALWEAHGRRPWDGPGAVVKVGLLPGDLDATLTWFQEVAGPNGYEVVGRAGLGSLLLRFDSDLEAQVRLVMELRRRLPAGRGSAVILRGTRELKRLVDVWGPIGDGFGLMQAVKRRFDPENILNPGRGPGGL